eukprot:7246650-Prymnesium_polylepis.1
MAAIMKVGTATSERIERRERPHRPCPLVQPLESAVPRPTARPAMAVSGVTRGGASKAEGNAVAISAPPPTRPTRKPILTGSRGPSTSALRTPLLPATRPAKSM